MTNETNTCRVEVLAHNSICTVGYCRRCNVFHVTLSSITLKLRPMEMHTLGSGMNHALDVFKQVVLVGDTLQSTLAPDTEPVH